MFIVYEISHLNGSVLIDTWWNVNDSSTQDTKNSGGRFNRYMVECELEQFLFNQVCAVGFNRYMVECELYHQYQ